MGAELPILKAPKQETQQAVPGIADAVNESVENAINKNALENVADSLKSTERIPQKAALDQMQELQGRLKSFSNKLSDTERVQLENEVEKQFDTIFKNSNNNGALKADVDKLDEMLTAVQDRVDPKNKTRGGMFRKSEILNPFPDVAQNGLDYVAKKRVNPSPSNKDISEVAFTEMHSRIGKLRSDIDALGKNIDFSDKPKAAAKYEELKASYNFLDEAAASEDMAYINQAKKAVESARKNFCNAMQKTGDTSYKSISGARYGKFIDSIDKIATDGKTAVKGATDVLETDADGFIKGDVSELLGIGKSDYAVPANVKAKSEETLKQEQAHINQQISDALHGKLSSGEMIKMGRTPATLVEHGAPDIEMAMPQTAIRKIAYPNGCMGGKHNLGFEAFNQFSKQMENPVAVLKSNTQDDSLVVLTELIDSHGKPVITPIHFGHDGMIEPYNKVASMYGREIDDFLEKARKEGKLLFEDKNRINNLRSAGLQLSGARASTDPMFDSAANGKFHFDGLQLPGVRATNDTMTNLSGEARNINATDKALLETSFDDLKVSPQIAEVKNKIASLMDYEQPVKPTIADAPKLNKALPLDLQRFAAQARKYETELEQIPEGEYKEKLKSALKDFHNDFQKAIDSNEPVKANEAFTILNSVYEQGGRKISKTYGNSIARGAGFKNDTQFNKFADVLSYETSSEKESVEAATKFLDKYGDNVAKSKLFKKDAFTHTDVDSMMMFIRKQTEKLDELEKSGADLSKAQEELHRLTKKLQDQTTRDAQAMQALAKWSRNTPEGMLMQAENIIKGKQGIDVTTELGRKMQKYFKDNNVEVSKEFETDFLKKAKEFRIVADKKGADSREAQEAMAELGKIVRKEIPVSMPSKFTSLLMDNMLGNFRTLISRNAGGNIGYNAMEQTVKTPIAAGIDRLLSLKTGARTQAGLSLDGLKEYDSGFKRGISDEFKDIKSGLHTARLGENTLENAIDANGRTFKNGLLNLYDQGVKHGLSFGDRGFYNGAYLNDLYNINKLRDQGLLGDAVQSLNDEQFADYAKKWATAKAKEAVYQDDSLISNGFAGIKKNLGEISKGTVGADLLSQTSMPFVKTPANVLARGIEYSPLGIVKNAINTGADIKSAGGLANINPMQQNRIANETARNIIGTGLFAGGAALANNGVITGAYDKDNDVKEAQKRSGLQEYALDTDKIPGIDQTPLAGKNYNYDWLSVIAPGIKSGAVAYDNFANGDDSESLIDKVGSAAGAGMQTQFDQSFFQGLQRLTGGSNTYNSDKGLMGNVGETITSAAGQGVPSLLRQITQTADPYQRYISGDGNYNLNSAGASIQGIRQKFEHKIDGEGNDMLNKQGRSIGQRAWENMLDPGTWTDKESTKIDDEAMRLYDSTGINTAFIPKLKRTDLEVGDNKPKDKDFTDYQKDVGKSISEVANGLIDNEGYKALADDEKADVLSDVYKAMKAKAKHDRGLVADDKYNEKIAKAFEESGAQGAIDYAVANKAITSAGLQNNDKTMDLYKVGGIPSLIDYQNAKEWGKAYTGKDDVNLGNSYAQAKAVLPSLDYNGFQQTIAALDKDRNGSISGGEIQKYLNSNNVADGEALIKAFYSNLKSDKGTWKKVNGKWVHYTEKGNLSKYK